MVCNSNSSKLVPVEHELVIELLNGKRSVHSFIAYSAFLAGADLPVAKVIASIKKHGAWKCSADMRPYGLMHDVVVQDAKGHLVCIEIDIDDVKRAYAQLLTDKLSRSKPFAAPSDDFIDYCWRDGLTTDDAVKTWN